MERVRKDPPVGVEAAAHRFAMACRRDGWTGNVTLAVDASSGEVHYIASGQGSFLSLIEGEWYEEADV